MHFSVFVTNAEKPAQYIQACGTVQTTQAILTLDTRLLSAKLCLSEQGRQVNQYLCNMQMKNNIPTETSYFVASPIK